MRRIFELQTDLMPPLNKCYPHIKKYHSKYLLKFINEAQLLFVLKNLGKHVDKVVLPEEVFKLYFRKGYYCYTQEWMKGFLDLSSFSTFEKKFSDKEILNFYKNLLTTCFHMHQAEVTSGDMWYRNILLDSNLDYRFIDFELRDTVLFPFDCKFFMEDFSFLERTMLSDKINLLTMILNSMRYGEFLQQRRLSPIHKYQDYDFPLSIQKKWMELMYLEDAPKEEDYFLEEFDTLIRIDYPLPYRKRKK